MLQPQSQDAALPTALTARLGGHFFTGVAALAASQLLGRAVGLAFTLALTRLVSREDFGIFNIGMTTATIAGLVQDLGISRTVVKKVSRNPATARLIVGLLVYLKLALAVVAGALVAGALFALGFERRIAVAGALCALIIPSASLWLLIENAAQGLRAIGLLSVGYLSVAVAQSTLALAAALFSKGDLEIVILSYALGNVVALAILWRGFTRVAGDIAPSVNFLFWRRIVLHSLPYLGAAAAVAALGRVEAVILGRLVGPAETAVFVVAFKMFETALFVAYSAQIAMNSIVAALIRDNRERFARWFAWETSLAAALLTPAVVAGVVIGPGLLALLFPPTYGEAALPLTILAGTLPISALQVFASGALMLTNHQRGILAISISTLVVQIALNFALVPHLGAVGAALAFASGQVFAAVACIERVRAWLLVGWDALRPLGYVLAVQTAAAVAGGLAAWWFGVLPGCAVALLVTLAGLVGRLTLEPPA